jgi:ribosomal protein S18 acetylase RimI-like enzyme
MATTTIELRPAVTADLLRLTEMDRMIARRDRRPAWDFHAFRTLTEAVNSGVTLLERRAGSSDVMVGYCAWVIRDECFRLGRVVIRHQDRRKGYGRAAVLALMKRARELDMAPSAVVRERDQTSQKFYQACGFRCVAIIRNFYSSPARKARKEDAYVFVLDRDEES